MESSVQACGFRRKRFQAELGLSLQVTEDSRDLASCLEAYFTDELMAGGNQWACDGCKGKVDCVNSWRLETAPNVLIITLKRFDPATLRKIARVLPFPAQLDLARYKVRPALVASVEVAPLRAVPVAVCAADRTSLCAAR